jgi:hypothetical protein
MSAIKIAAIVLIIAGIREQTEVREKAKVEAEEVAEVFRGYSGLAAAAAFLIARDFVINEDVAESCQCPG